MSDAKPLLIILAGGQSRRMGRDKAEVFLGGRRLVDIAIERFAPMVGEVVLSAPQDYGTGRSFVPDFPDAPAGPVGGIWSVSQWLREHRKSTDRFFTIPVDTPLLPLTLFADLGRTDGCAVVATTSGPHPTCALWEMAALTAAFEQLRPGQTISLRALATACAAQSVHFGNEAAFTNINTPEDLARVKTLGP